MQKLFENFNKRYRIVSDFGYGDRTWLERDLTEQQVIDWFIANRKYPPDTTFEECPNDSDFTYFYEEDDPNDEVDWDWQDS